MGILAAILQQKHELIHTKPLQQSWRRLRTLGDSISLFTTTTMRIYVPRGQIILPVLFSHFLCIYGTMQGPVGLLGTRSFCSPHFFDYRKQPSFDLHDLPWVPMGRLKRLWIREGRGCETREKQWKAALGQGPISASRGTHDNNFELFCRYWNPVQVGEVNK